MAVTWRKLAFDTEKISHSLATAANDFLVASGSGAFIKKTLAETQLILGMGQRVYAHYTDYAYGSATIPLDDTKPQNTEGTQFMSRTITPKSATSILQIDVWLMGGVSGSALHFIMALFKDTDADALAVAVKTFATANYFCPICLSYRMVSGTLSEITFKVRAGCHTTGSALMNGSSTGGRLMGGTMMSAITVTEYQ